MSNTNTKVLLVGAAAAAAAAAKLLIDELDNEVNILEQIVAVQTIHLHPLEMPACYKIHKPPSWSEMNKGKLSKRARRK